jgi:hypothetical protein
MTQQRLTSPLRKFNLKMEETEDLAEGTCLQLTCPLWEQMDPKGWKEGQKWREEKTKGAPCCG